MGLITVEQYYKSLKRMRPNLYKFGELIEDVTEHPATKWTVKGHAQAIEGAHNPETTHIFTTKSHFDGETIFRWTSLMQTPEELMANSVMKRKMYHLNGTCSGALCVGWNSMNVLWSVTYEMDKKLGTDYHPLLQNYMKGAQKCGWLIAGALTDAKGNRALPPSKQKDLDLNMHVKEVREDGIVVSGIKAMICGVAASNEIMVMPGSTYGEVDADWAVAFAVPRDIEGLTLVEARRPSDQRDLEEGFDNPNKVGGITQAYLIFEDVFVPRDRVFMCREFKYCRDLILRFTSNYRACIGACVAGQGDVMIGAAINVARANGLSARVFNDKYTRMILNNETTYGLGLGAILAGRKHESGPFFADPLLAHSNKLHVATLPYETKVICQDCAGGFAETGCMPSYKDFIDSRYGEKVQLALSGAVSGEIRARIGRLIEWLTLGGGVPGCMHGGGSPDGAKMVMRAFSPLEEYAKIARRLAGVEEEIPEPENRK